MTQPLLYLLALSVLIYSGIGEARKANEAYNKGDYAMADSLYKLAIDEDPDNAQLYFNLGNALAKQQKVEEAIEAYMTSEGLSTDAEEKAMAQYNIGTLLAEGEKWKPATLHFRNALKLNPTDLDAKHNYELAANKAEDEENEQQDQQDQNQQPPKPSEYAKAVKKQAEKLVAERKYRQALQLMNNALSVDETVQAYNDFIQRIGTIDQIDS